MTPSDDGSDPALDRALRRMGTSVVPVEEPTHLDARRALLMPELTSVADRMFTERRRRGSWAARVAIAAGVLSVCLGAFALGSMYRDGANSSASVAHASVLSRDGAVRVGSEGTSGEAVDRVPFALRDRDRVETLDGRAEVRLASGASVALDPRTRLDLDAVKRSREAVDERVVLPSGRIHVRVPKLGDRSRLVIATPNASVTVHGTAFVVDVGPALNGSAMETRVSVTEGVVSVASGGREVFLNPGATWSSATVEVPPSEAAGATSAARPEAAAPPGASAPKRSTLSDENELFKAALAARRAGHPEQALELLRKLLTKYPSSPLAGQARAERDRTEAEIRPVNAP